MGNRKIALVKEITKLHEEVINTTFDEALEMYSEKSPKGEFVLIIEGKKEEIEAELTLEDAVHEAKKLIEGGMSINNASKEIASKTPFKKGDIYRELV